MALVVAAAGATLGLVKSGVIDTNNTSSPSATQTTTHHHAASSPTVPLVSQVTTGNGTATYRIDIAAYLVTVTTSTGRSWVSIGAAESIRPSRAFSVRTAPRRSSSSVLPRSMSAPVGTKVTITSGKRTSTLTPVAAPFSYSRLIKS